MSISMSSKGDYGKLTDYLKRMNRDANINLVPIAERGLEALRHATPYSTGLTSESWTYDIVTTSKGSKVVFRNTNIQNGVPIAIILQYGHATRSGTWVEGIDYINPALKPIFENLAYEAGRVVNDR